MPKQITAWLNQYKLGTAVYWLLSIIAITTALQIALNTAFNVHPDEVIHVNAFKYFEIHSWPPDLNSNEVLYSPQGWSRVYTGEVVYYCYGMLYRIIDSVVETKLQNVIPRFQTYRLLNVSLYAITLLIIFKVGKKHTWATIIGLGLVSIPQIIYLYSYANSDAWGLSFNLFLFLFVIAHPRTSLVSSRHSIILGILTGLLFLVKKPYWLILPFAYLPLSWVFMQELKRKNTPWIHKSLRNMAIVLAMTFIISAPLKIIYPLTQQGNFSEQVEQMREIRAREDFKPSNPTYPGYRPASRGEPFRSILMNSLWIMDSIKSFYGLFGYMSVRLSSWIYISMGSAILLCSFCTIRSMLQSRKTIPNIAKLMIMASPFMVTLNVFVSMYNSWTNGFQPQGRYLFPSFVPIILIIGGTVEFEPRWLRIMRTISVLSLYILCIYVVQFVVLRNTSLLAS